MLLFTCICGLMMNVLYIETSATVSASDISNEDKVKNNVFGIVTLVLNIAALSFIIFTVLPEYRVIKRVIFLIQKVCPCILSRLRLPNSAAEPHRRQDARCNYHHPQKKFGRPFRLH